MITTRYDSSQWERRRRSGVKRCPVIHVRWNPIEITALIDTGAEVSVISQDLFERLKERAEVPTLPMNRTYVVGPNRKRSAPITKQVMLDVWIGEHCYEVIFLVVQKLMHEMILGFDFLAEQRGMINFNENIIVLRSPVKLHCDIVGDDLLAPREEYEMDCFEGKLVDDKIIRKVSMNETMTQNQKPPHILAELDREGALGPRAIASQAQVRRNLIQAARRRRKGSGVRGYRFYEGQNVFLRVPKLSDPKLKLYGKFFPLFEGPYRIRRIPTRNVAELETEEGEVIGVYNFFNLRPG